MKEIYNFECQVCGQTLMVPEGRYCETAYVRPLGNPHGGSDFEDNILCLCPNHRVMFEHGTFGVGSDFQLIGIRLYKSLRVHPEHKIKKENLEYHHDHILERQP